MQLSHEATVSLYYTNPMVLKIPKSCVYITPANPTGIALSSGIMDCAFILKVIPENGISY